MFTKKMSIIFFLTMQMHFIYNCFLYVFLITKDQYQLMPFQLILQDRLRLECLIKLQLWEKKVYIILGGWIGVILN